MMTDTTTVRQQQGDHWPLITVVVQEDFPRLPQSLCTTGKVTHWKWQEVNDSRNLTYGHTVQYKHYENAFLSSSFIQSVIGAWATIPPFWYEVWIFMSYTHCYCVLTVPWFWQTLETGLMHHSNNICKQTSQWFTNQTEDSIVSFALTHITPHALHNSLEFSYITYMLHSLNSYFTDNKGKHISMQSVSCFAFLYI